MQDRIYSMTVVMEDLSRPRCPAANFADTEYLSYRKQEEFVSFAAALARTDSLPPSEKSDLLWESLYLFYQNST